MEIEHFLQEIEKSSLSLRIENEKLILEIEENKFSKEKDVFIKNNQEIINYIRNNKAELIKYLSGLDNNILQKRSEKISSLYRLSDLQQGMLFHGLYEQGSGAYVEQFGCELVSVDIEQFIRSWAHLIRHHSILRSGFEYDAFKVPVQCVYKEAVMPVELLDYREKDEAEQQQAIRDYEATDRRRGFDFKAPPLMRVGLLRLTEERYFMLWSHHHIISDGWSGSILMGEFLSVYENLVTGAEMPKVHEDKYEDYIRYIEKRDRHKQEQYWRGYLKGVEGASLLPFIATTTERNKGLGQYKEAPLLFDETKTAAITTYAQSHKITVNTLMQGVWSYLLHRYTGNPHVVYGVTVSGRPDDLPGVEERVGLYINTLPLHSALGEDLGITEWLQSVQQQQLESREYQYTGLNTIQGWAGIQGDLFDTLLVFENYPVSKVIASRAWLLQASDLKVQEQVNYPLGIIITAGADISIRFNYNADLIEAVYIEQLLGHFEQVLLQITEERAAKVGQLQLLTEPERRELLFDFNDTSADYPKDKTIVDLFALQAAKTPDSIAVVFGEDELTYRQLDERSNQLGHYLRSRGVREDSLVAICLERSMEMITGILGILKAGGAYVPIDPDYPQERIAYMLEDTAAQIALTAADVQLPPAEGVAVINMNDAIADIEQHSTAKVKTKLLPSHLAYVIYTSGSTGRPKGVMIEHKGLINYIFSIKSNYINENLDGSGTFVHLSYAFDASITAMFLPLISGKITVFSSQNLLTTFEEDIILQKYAPYDFIKLTPSHLEFIEQTVNLSQGLSKRIIVGGEALSVEHLKHLVNKNITVINEYGPTESTVGCTTYSLIIDYGISNLQDTIPIGRPIANTQLYILDQDQGLLPIGVTGEICIGGAGLARGYLNRSDLTAEKFIPHPFSTEQDARIYKTGDLGRWLPDGNIEFLGRIDDQLKIRGYRIEPGEIESALVQTGLVQQAVVLAKEDSLGNKRLIGYVVPGYDYQREAALAYLRSRLPDYMVPGLLVELDALPLTHNGKTDRKALLQLDLSGAAQHEYEAPRNEPEEKLAAIWTDLLGVERIGIHDNFFELGGHSLLAMRLVSSIRRELGLEVSIGTIFNHATIALLAAYISGTTEPLVALPPILTGARPEKIPLSFSQERLWFIDALEGSRQYHLPFVLRLNGELDSMLLEKALMTIVNRHEVLRTVIREEDGRAYQLILDTDGWILGTSDGFAYTDQEALNAKIDQLISAPFNLAADYMLRGDLIKTGAAEHVLVGTMHHIISDGWSIPILVKELAELYNAFTDGRPYELPALPVQYADYAIWQRLYLSGEVLENKMAYWQQQLAGAQVLNLPTDYSRAPIRSSNGASAVFRLDKDLSTRLESISLENGATLYMTLLSVFNILLYKYTGQDDICIGSPVAGRQLHEVEGLIGFFINTLVLRNRLSQELTFRDFLLQVRKTTLDAYAHQELPFEKIVEALVKERDMSRSPLFDVMFVLQNNAQADSLEDGLSGLSISFEGNQDNTSKFDISVTLQEHSGGISGSITYNSDLYDHGTIERMLAHYQRLLQAVAADQNLPVGQLQLLTEPERRELLFDFNDTSADYPKDKTIVDLFALQAAKTPDSIAVVFGEDELTYRQLDERSNQLGHYLRSRGVREDSLVAICLERSMEMITGILGILKAGGAYVPIDPDYPQERIAYMLEDTAAQIALTAADVQLPPAEGVAVINMNDAIADIEQHSTAKVKTKLLPSHLAYVIYTSGSTGRPKGVMIEHKGLINRLSWAQDYYNLNKTDTLLQKTNFCFDVSVWEFMWPLIMGAKFVFAKKNGHKDNDYLRAIIKEKKITMVHFVPSMLSAFLFEYQSEELGSLRMVLCSGEELKLSVVKLFNNKLPKVRLYNLYGPTEASIDVTYWALSIEKKDIITIPIGRPIANTQLYILDQDQGLLPIGVTGEICIGGAGLARGYLNRPDLTAEKFIPHPFSTEQDARIYKTGDLGRWLPDGNIEFLGRIDDQLKIRGYRIEPGEIESALVQTGLVQQAVVLAKEDSLGNKRLIGYVVPGYDYQREAALAYLHSRLPDYMVPGLLVELDALPLTHNGKTDRKALLQLDLSGAAQHEYEAPRNEPEEKLAAIWTDLLGVERIGIHDNFFELGGDSIITIQVVSRLRHAGYSTRPRDIFMHQTIAALAAAIAAQDNSAITAEQGTLTGKSGLLPIQQWYLNRQGGQLSHYNQSVLLATDKSITVEVLQLAVQLLAERHDALRFCYEQSSSGWEQLYSPGPVLPLIAEDLTTANELLGLRIKDISNDHQRSLDIHNGELIRVVLINTADDQSHNRLLIVIHHLVVDGVSWRILLGHLELIVSALIKGNTPLAGNKTSSYREWYNALAEYGNSSRLLAQRSYWHKAVQCYRPLSYDYAYDRPVKIKDAENYSSRLSLPLTQALLQDVPAVYHTEINDILLAALAKTITEWARSEDIVIGLEGHGREDILDGIDLSHTVGWFTSVYPLLLSKGAGAGPGDWIKGVKEQLRKVPDKGLGYGVLKYINKEPQLQGESPWDIVFNYLGQLDNVLNQDSNYLTAAGESTGEQADPNLPIGEKLSVNSMVAGGELVLNWGYSSLHFRQERIQELADAYLRNLELLISHCSEQNSSGIVFTPSDYGLGNEIAYDELDSFLRENGNTENDTIIDL